MQGASTMSQISRSTVVRLQARSKLSFDAIISDQGLMPSSRHVHSSFSYAVHRHRLPARSDLLNTAITYSVATSSRLDFIPIHSSWIAEMSAIVLRAITTDIKRYLDQLHADIRNSLIAPVRLANLTARLRDLAEQTHERVRRGLKPIRALDAVRQ
jgi:hypothetical protein